MHEGRILSEYELFEVFSLFFSYSLALVQVCGLEDGKEIKIGVH